MKQVQISKKEANYLELNMVYNELMFSEMIVRWMREANRIEKYPAIRIIEGRMNEYSYIEQIGKPLK